ncbi:hypothetical protein HY409_04130 [Candidatus Gottesmanbacteria bacterium]|nr:hypothetical protein [Candidatus Gottesmanbacteria bacterium]
MDQTQATIRSKELGALIDLVTDVDPVAQPFLHFLPQLLEQKILHPISLRSFVVFAQAAIKRDTDPLLRDALHILNQLIDPLDGVFTHPFASDIF